MRILAFAASNSSVSINRQLVEYAASLADGAEVELLDIHDYEMPLYRHDREEEAGIPQLAHSLAQSLGNSWNFICTKNHHHNKEDEKDFGATDE